MKNLDLKKEVQSKIEGTELRERLIELLERYQNESKYESRVTYLRTFASILREFDFLNFTINQLTAKTLIFTIKKEDVECRVSFKLLTTKIRIDYIF